MPLHQGSALTGYTRYQDIDDAVYEWYRMDLTFCRTKLLQTASFRVYILAEGPENLYCIYALYNCIKKMYCTTKEV